MYFALAHSGECLAESCQRSGPKCQAIVSGDFRPPFPVVPFLPPLPPLYAARSFVRRRSCAAVPLSGRRVCTFPQKDGSVQLTRVEEMLKLIDELMKLCKFGTSKDMSKTEKKFSINKHFRQIVRLVSSTSILMPTQRALTAVLPFNGKVDSSHYPYPAETVTIGSFDDTVEVMASMQVGTHSRYHCGTTRRRRDIN